LYLISLCFIGCSLGWWCLDHQDGRHPAKDSVAEKKFEPQPAIAHLVRAVPSNGSYHFEISGSVRAADRLE
jgi:hypothetical protein